MGQWHAGEWTGNVGGYLGQKTLNDKGWPQHDEQGSIGMALDFMKKNWPISLAVDLLGTGDEGESGSDKQEVYTAEAHIGLRMIFELLIPDCKLRPYVRGGVAFIHTEDKNRVGDLTAMDDGSGCGYWVGTGTYFRVSEAEVEVFGEEREAGGLLVSFGAGYHW